MVNVRCKRKRLNSLKQVYTHMAQTKGVFLLILSTGLFALLWIVGFSVGFPFEKIFFCFSVPLVFYLIGITVEDYFTVTTYVALRTVLNCHSIDLEMFVGEQLYYEDIFDDIAQKFVEASWFLEED